MSGSRKTVQSSSVGHAGFLLAQKHTIVTPNTPAWPKGWLQLREVGVLSRSSEFSPWPVNATSRLGCIDAGRQASRFAELLKVLLHAWCLKVNWLAFPFASGCWRTLWSSKNLSMEWKIKSQSHSSCSGSFLLESRMFIPSCLLPNSRPTFQWKLVSVWFVGVTFHLFIH